MRQELEWKLYEKYPSLFIEQSLPATKSLMCFGPCYGDGWFDIIERICGELNGFEGISFCQIKQKFGSLRIYVTYRENVPKSEYEAVESILEKYEIESGKTCEDCGKPGKMRSGGWITVRCDECENKRNSKQS